LPKCLKVTSTPLKIPHHGKKKNSIHEELEMKKFKNTFTKPSSSFLKTLITYPSPSFPPQALQHCKNFKTTNPK
jgi:hypothetical protein